MNNFTPLKNVKIDSPFWKAYTDIAKDKIIPYQWLAINDRVPDTAPSHAIRNFRVAAGLEEGPFGGMVFQDSDVAKWLEAVAYRLTIDPDPEVEKTADEVIDLIGMAQEEDGYLNTYFQIKEPDKKFTNLLDCHELYCAGHMTEAAVAYYEATGKDKLLKIMCRYIDLIDSKIGPEEGKIKGYPGHPEIELALVKLYRVTGEKRYLKLCEFMVNERGAEPNYFDLELEARNHITHWGGGYQRNVDKQYCQAHKPIRQQTEAVGHSVRAGYLYTGCADLAAETGDESLKHAMEVIWDNITEKQMYVTGGIGAQVYGEAFSFNYHLPNDTVYAETCAQISMVFFAQRMLRMDVDRKYSDVMERLIYNSTISGMALDGRHFFYTNPLSVWEEETKRFPAVRHNLSRRPGWFGCACCPPNLARMITSLGNYVYSSDENTVYTHLYIGGEADISVGDKTVHLTQTGNYPWCGDIGFTLSEGKYTFAFRIPGWARSFAVKVNGSSVSPEIRKGYAYITREWKNGDTVELTLPMPVELVEANPMAREDAGKAAIMRGPVVYCLEAADNGDVLSSIRLTGEFEIYEDNTLFDGAVNIRASAMRRKAWTSSALYRTYQPGDEESCTVTAIPYAFWTNREDTREMTVWVRV